MHHLFNQPMNTPSSGEKSATNAIPAAISLLMLLVSAILAIQLSAGVIGTSYSHWITGAAPAVNDDSAMMKMANRVATAFPSMVSMGIARAIIMVITFAIGATLLVTTTNQRLSVYGALGTSLLFVFLSLLLLFFGSVRFVMDQQFSFVDFFMHAGLSVLLMIFASALIQILRRPRVLIWYAVPFMLLLVVHLLLMVLASRVLALDVRFLGNVLYLVVIGLIAGSLAYSYKFLSHLQSK